MPAIDTGWTEATPRADLPEDDVVGVTVEGRDVALYTVDGEVFATDNLCTHGNARLCDGFLEGHEIECPLHQGRFDVRDGSALCAPLTQGLRSYPVRVEQGTVYLKLA
ncbi:non-heme iron oxygenase ferredoxin subunit [Acidovorax sp. SUPP1855]|uniref:non-heme iron oxygenase ferredoxin subunit n=1 Tax=Acidovorax sp. SUPP1855 TaxID=431774 RepID=UPI0023DE2289|nr:non-heme iron oxygenase ferredoxin subunit [Acidovorax sp. SUPP1855]GKS84010.1 non-heme iron oxygenase ferredoxin subunit [Acidovorax sp. SUPP1855]